ncbi:MAG: DUF4956 domain-containing protein [Bacteroidetes bacterium]|jgi:uncharacterized membrane protein YhiD involved in acid resistance|nr:DUF4956 domain-containing protein [Bacteroidota bacterium]MDF1865566.1 DUF4956 domain-containing protein [Saprospiraceae bacterium]
MNNELDFLTQFFNAESQGLAVPQFILHLLTTTFLALSLGWIYVRFGTSLSNRRALAKTLVLVSLTTMIIISIVKSSLALSLGLVGALSIVRFRTAIKEPEELAYFFMSIAIGLGIGAGQIWATLIGTTVLFLVAFMMNRSQNKDIAQNLIIQFSSPKTGEELNKVIAILEKSATQLELRRLDEASETSEVAFAIGFKNFNALTTAKDELQKAYPEVKFSFLEMV